MYCLFIVIFRLTDPSSMHLIFEALEGSVQLANLSEQVQHKTSFWHSFCVCS